MNLEIHKPELVERVNAHIQTGHFQDVEEVLERALTPSTKASPLPPWQTPQNQTTGADLIAALQASPYREVDIEPARFRSSSPLRDVTF